LQKFKSNVYAFPLPKLSRTLGRVQEMLRFEKEWTYAVQITIKSPMFLMFRLNNSSALDLQIVKYISWNTLSWVTYNLHSENPKSKFV